MTKYRSLPALMTKVIVLVAAGILATSAGFAAEKGDGKDAPIITPERMKAVSQRALAADRETTLSDAYITALALSPPFITRQTGFPDKTNPSIIHGFAAHTGNSGKVIIFVKQKQTNVTMIWVCDMDASLLSAGKLENDQFSPIPMNSAKAGFEAELRLWSRARLDAPPPGER